MKKGKKRNDVLEEAAAMPLSDEDLETVSGGTCPPCQTVRPQSGELADEELDNVSGGGCGPTYYEACMANGYCSDYICSRCGSRGIIVRNGELRCSGCLAYNPRCWNCMNSIGDKRSKILTCKVRLRRGTPE